MDADMDFNSHNDLLSGMLHPLGVGSHDPAHDADMFNHLDVDTMFGSTGNAMTDMETDAFPHDFDPHADLLQSSFLNSLDSAEFGSHLYTDNLHALDLAIDDQLFRLPAYSPYHVSQHHLLPANSQIHPQPPTPIDNALAAAASRTKAKRVYKKRKSDEFANGLSTASLGSPKKKSMAKHHSDMTNSSSAMSPKYGLSMASRKPGLYLDPSAPKSASFDGMPITPRSDLKQTSTFRGVSCCGKDRKWQARIRDANRVRYLGRFTTEVEAALVYDDAARQLKGERAPTNFYPLDRAQRESLKAAFIANGNQIPESFMQYVIKVKGKSSEPKSCKSSAGQPDLDAFPDSPMAKVKGVAPAISPSSLKSIAPKRAVNLQSRMDFSASSAVGKKSLDQLAMQQQQQHAL